VVITMKDDFVGSFENDLKHLSHILLDRLRIRPAQLSFQFLTSAFLYVSHPALTAQFAVGEVQYEVVVLFYRDVMVVWIVLAVLERLEAVDDDLLDRRAVLHHQIVEQHTLAGHT
jgi:hypothetical protein